MSKDFVEQMLEALKKSARHDMHPSVCKGCNQSHHYIVCPYDFLFALDETGKLNELFEQSLKESKSQKTGVE